jgi:hypothetical protein
MIGIVANIQPARSCFLGIGRRGPLALAQSGAASATGTIRGTGTTIGDFGVYSPTQATQRPETAISLRMRGGRCRRPGSRPHSACDHGLFPANPACGQNGHISPGAAWNGSCWPHSRAAKLRAAQPVKRCYGRAIVTEEVQLLAKVELLAKASGRSARWMV